MFFLAINHFQTSQTQQKIEQSTLFAASLCACEANVSVLVVDGSDERNPHLEAELEGIGIRA